MVQSILSNGSYPALLVVDMQNAYCHSLGSYDRCHINIDHLAAVIPNVVRVRDAMRDKGLPIIYTQTSFAPDYSDSGLSLESSIGRDLKSKAHLLRGTWDSALVYQLLPNPSGFPRERIVDKTRPSAFFGTDLAHMLRDLGVNEVILAGALTNVSIESTARDAFSLDFRVAILGDATATFRQDDHTSSLLSMGWMGQVLPTAKFETALAAGTYPPPPVKVTDRSRSLANGLPSPASTDRGSLGSVGSIGSAMQLGKSLG